MFSFIHRKGQNLIVVRILCSRTSLRSYGEIQTPNRADSKCEAYKQWRHKDEGDAQCLSREESWWKVHAQKDMTQIKPHLTVLNPTCRSRTWSFWRKKKDKDTTSCGTPACWCYTLDFLVNLVIFKPHSKVMWWRRRQDHFISPHVVVMFLGDSDWYQQRQLGAMQPLTIGSSKIR